MSVAIDLGVDDSGRAIELDLGELLATRLLVQGNSGSGKSHLLRRLLEGSAGLVQQIVIDPEGDFATLGEPFGHTVIDAGSYSLAEIGRIAAQLREHRASAILNLEALEIDDQMRCAATFVGALFDAPREHWFPALVVIDEAQLFAPAAAGEVADDARRSSLAAMTNLMCRGRKRGLAGVIATQRLAKLAKNVAAEASNFLMGRTFLDIDMIRAADLLGMERRQADTIRDLARGQFLGLGPAIARRPVMVRIGAVRTASNSAAPALLPLPGAGEFAIDQALLAPEPAPLPSYKRARPVPSAELLRTIERSAPTPAPDLPPLSEDETRARLDAILAELAGESAGELRKLPQLYQEFTLRCRMAGVAATPDLEVFRRDFAIARAGLDPGEDWADALALARSLPDEMLAPFLRIAGAARHSAPCPDDLELARIYGTASLGRARRMLGHMEERGLIVIRTDLAGERSIALPHLGWRTAASAASRAA